MEQEVLRRADRVAVFSEFSRRLVSSINAGLESKIIRLSVGIDTERFLPPPLNPPLGQGGKEKGGRAQACERLALPQNKRMILTVRRFSPRMGLPTLIDAMKIVREKIPEARLMIVGEGPLTRVLRKKIANEGLQGYVTLVGTVPLEDLPLYYQCADLFVLPTEAFEGLGMATLEALACGVPVVGTPSGATPEVLRDLDQSLLTHGTSADDLARGILDFFARSEAEREAFSRKARSIVEEKYNWDKAVEELEKVLNTLIHPH